MKSVLILGGTNFIGRVLVEKLKNHPNYSLTLFNRGHRNAGLFAEIPQLHGDRETADINLITEDDWDYIIDLSGYYPASLGRLLEAIKGRVGRYIFVSTISVYPLGNSAGNVIDETEPLLPCSEAQMVSKLPDAYGEKKAEMERLLLNCEWLNKIILRPSLVYGKYDFTDRFYYWLWRARFAEKMVLPDGGIDLCSITFVEDLADLLMAAMELSPHNTVYNAATHQVSLRQLVETCCELLKTKPGLVPIDGQQLVATGLHPWQDIGLWTQGDLNISLDRVKRDFNTDFTPFAETISRTIAYYESLGWPECKYGMSLTKESELWGV